MKFFNRSLSTSVLMLCCALVLSACATTTQKEDEQQEKLAMLHYQIGVDALQKGLLPKAFDELMTSDNMRPNQAEVLDALAYAWLLRGDMEKSEAHYRKSLRVKARASTQNNYANLLNKLERFSEAESMARKALDDPRYPNQDLAFINLADALLGQDKFDDAIRSYGQAQLFNSNNTLVKLRIAHAYMQHDRLNEARALYDTLLLQNPNSRIVVMGLLEILEKQNDRQQARQILNQFKNQSIPDQDKAWATDKLERLK